MQGELIERAAKLLEDGTINRVLGWAAGDFVYDITPTVFDNAEDVKKRFVYDDFCGANLSKYLVPFCFQFEDLPGIRRFVDALRKLCLCTALSAAI